MSLLDELQDTKQSLERLEQIRAAVRVALRQGWSASRIGLELANSPGLVHKLFDGVHQFRPETIAVVYDRLKRLEQPIFRRYSATERYL